MSVSRQFPLPTQAEGASAFYLVHSNNVQWNPLEACSLRREKCLLPWPCPVVCPRLSAQLPLDGFSWNLILVTFKKICRLNPIFYKNRTKIWFTLHGHQSALDSAGIDIRITTINTTTNFYVSMQRSQYSDIDDSDRFTSTLKRKTLLHFHGKNTYWNAPDCCYTTYTAYFVTN
jgi:hypothetical protein